MKIVEFIDVYKAFDKKQVLQGLSFDVRPGTKLCIMGPSGCGKTTIVNLLLGIIKPDTGIIKAPDKAGVVFQENRLFEEFSALSNVCAITSKKNKDLCVRLLEGMGLGEELKTPTGQLSGGMKRRVAIARALAAETDFYILDEPFKGLDDDTRDEVIKFVKKELTGKTAIIVTHQKDEAEKLGAKIMLLNTQGKLVLR